MFRCALFPTNGLHRFKTGDIKLSVWLEHLIDGERVKVSAFESIVTVVEPELSIFDFKLYVTLPLSWPRQYSNRVSSLSTYAIVLAILSGLGYVTYLSFMPQPKQKKTVPISAPESTATATGAGGYQEEWIPEHHLRKTKARKAGGTALSSGDEQSGQSGAEASGTEGKRRSSRLRK